MKKGLRNTGLDKNHTCCFFFFFWLEHSHRYYIFLQISNKRGRIITFSWVRRVRNVIQGRIYRRLNLGAQCFYESWLSTPRRMASFTCQHTLWLRLNSLFLHLKLLLFPPTRKKKCFQPPTSPLGHSRLPCSVSTVTHHRDGCHPCHHRGQMGCTECAASALFWWHVCDTCVRLCLISHPLICTAHMLWRDTSVTRAWPVFSTALSPSY